MTQRERARERKERAREGCKELKRLREKAREREGLTEQER